MKKIFLFTAIVSSTALSLHAAERSPVDSAKAAAFTFHLHTDNPHHPLSPIPTIAQVHNNEIFTNTERAAVSAYHDAFSSELLRLRTSYGEVLNEKMDRQSRQDARRQRFKEMMLTEKNNQS